MHHAPTSTVQGSLDLLTAMQYHIQADTAKYQYPVELCSLECYTNATLNYNPPTIHTS